MCAQRCVTSRLSHHPIFLFKPINSDYGAKTTKYTDEAQELGNKKDILPKKNDPKSSKNNNGFLKTNPS